MFVFASISFSNTGLGYFLSSVVSPENVQLASVLVTMILGAFFGGVIPTMREVYEDDSLQLYVTQSAEPHLPGS